MLPWTIFGSSLSLGSFMHVMGVIPLLTTGASVQIQHTMLSTQWATAKPCTCPDIHWGSIRSHPALFFLVDASYTVLVLFWNSNPVPKSGSGTEYVTQ